MPDDLLNEMHKPWICFSHTIDLYLRLKTWTMGIVIYITCVYIFGGTSNIIKPYYNHFTLLYWINGFFPTQNRTSIDFLKIEINRKFIYLWYIGILNTVTRHKLKIFVVTHIHHYLCWRRGKYLVNMYNKSLIKSYSFINKYFLVNE